MQSSERANEEVLMTSDPEPPAMDTSAETSQKDPDELPYRVESEDDWWQKLKIKTWEQADTKGYIALEAVACPRCNHPFKDRLVRGIIGPGVPRDDHKAYYKTPGTQRVDWIVKCRCGKRHPGKPRNDSGCGARIGLIVLIPDIPDYRS